MICYETDPTFCEKLQINVTAKATGENATEAWAAFEAAVLEMQERTAVEDPDPPGGESAASGDER